MQIEVAADGTVKTPHRPIIPFIEGDGTGRDIWRASVRVFDAAVAKALRGRAQDRSGWRSTPARRRSSRPTTGCPTRPSRPSRQYLVGIKGPLTTPVGGGIRSLNVALRQMLDLYVCLRPVRYFNGVPSPVKRPEKVDMVIFRENTEDIYAGIEWPAESPEAKKVIAFLQTRDGRQEDPLPADLGHRHQAGLARGHGAADARRPRLRPPAQAQERDPGPQGQHHEVHRGRVPRLGLRAGQARVRAAARSAGTTAAASRRPARSWSRTPSPTSRCSRC